MPSVLVLPHARVPGLSADPSKVVTNEPVVPLQEALSGAYGTDGHVQLAIIDGVASQPRLTKGSLARLRSEGHVVKMHAVFVDFDGPDHAPDEAWRADFDAHVARLPTDLAAPTLYHTRGGARLVWPLLRQLDPEEFERFLPAVHQRIEAHGLDADRACKDWTRLFRLPFVRRDGVDQRLDLHLGDGVLDADAIGIPSEPPPRSKATRTPRQERGAAEDAPDQPGKGRDWTAAYGCAPAAMTVHERARRWLAVRPSSGEHERNTSTYKTACALVCAFDLDREALETLLDDYNGRSEPPLPPEEVAQILGSAWTWSRAQERGTALAAPPIETTPPSCSVFDQLPPGGFPEAPSCDTEEAAAHTVILLESCRHNNATEAIEVLASCDEIYTRNNMLVHVVDQSIIKPVRPARLAELLARSAQWMKSNQGRLESCGPPPWLIDTVFARESWPDLRALAGIVGAPCLRPDGSVLDTAGFDSATGLMLASPLLVNVPNRPTGAETAAALELLEEVLCDFPFEAPEHRSVALAAILSPFARTMHGGPTPLFLFDATTPASGKGLLAAVVAIIGLGRRPPVMTPSDPDEERKRIIALAMMGASMVLLDEYERLDSPALRSALTEGRASGRPLGTNDFVDLDFTPVWMAAANNIAVLGDMPRRVLPCRLAPIEERPEERGGFKHDPLGRWVTENRGRLVGAALTVLRAYIVAGCPKQSITSFGSFEGWSDLVRSAIVWVGAPDPLLAQRLSAVSGDDRVEALKVSLREWWDVQGAKPLALGEVEMGGAGRFSELARMLAIIASEKDGKMDKRKVGQFMRRFRGRAIDGFRLESTGHGRYGQLWVLRKADDTSPLAQARDDDTPLLARGALPWEA